MAFGFLVEHAKFRSTYALLDRSSVQMGQLSGFEELTESLEMVSQPLK
jgi:hypothetical protein